MSVWIHVEENAYEIGSMDFLNAFFSNIVYHLENGAWGRKFPTLMNELYRGSLEGAHAKIALLELANAQEGLTKFKPADAIWDSQDRARKPSDEFCFPEHYENLSDCFRTPNGTDLIEVLSAALFDALETGSPAEIY